MPIRSELLNSLNMTLCCMVSYGAGLFLSLFLKQPHAVSMISALWAVISTTIVFDSKSIAIKQNIHIRIVGTLVGGIFAWLVFSSLGFNWWSFCLAIFLTMLMCALLRIEPFRLACLCIALIYVVSSLNPKVSVTTNVILRFIESCIGAYVPWIVGWPFRYWQNRLSS